MSDTPAAPEKGQHHRFLKKKLHARIRHFTGADIHHLSRARTPGGLAEGSLPAWFAALPVDQRQIVRDSQARSRTSNETLAKTLKGFKSVAEFAQPLLEAALEKKFGLQVDTTKTWWYSEILTDALGTDQTLLQLALRNFREGQTFSARELIAEQGEPAPMGRGSEGLYGWYYPKSGPSKCYKIKKLPIPPAEFAALCRELDIGKQYQDHLQAIFDAEDKRTAVKAQTITAWKDNLRVHAHLAHAQARISPSGYLALLGVLNGEKNPQLDGEAVAFSQLYVLGSAVSEMFVIGARRRKGKKIDFSWNNPGVNLFDVLTYKDSRIIVCIPGDPVAPVKEYPSLRAFEKDLALRLRGVNYQRWFMRLVPHGEAGKFLGKIQPALQTLKWNADFAYRGQGMAGSRDGAYERVYHDEPQLDIIEAFFAGELFNELYDRHEKRLKTSAEQLAVPTAKVDYDAWYERMMHYAEWGLSILNVAAFFVPGLGEVMMAVMAVQLTMDVYHGVQAWSIGDTDLAWHYLGAVAANVAFMAVAGAAASKAPKILATPIVEGLVKVRLPFGDEQLWRPGLAPYKSATRLPAGLAPDALGQYTLDGKSYLKIDGEVYEKTFDPQANRWRIKHPDDPQAYHPVLEHNGQGAWRHGFERPLEWDRATLLRRLGPATDGFDVATLERIGDLSGVDDAALRAMHTDNLPMPSTLADTLRQFRIDRQLNEMIEQIRLGQAVPDDLYPYAVPEMVNLSRWPQGRVIEVFDPANPSSAVSRYGQATTPARSAIRVSRSQVSAGQLPEQVLAALDEQETVTLLGFEGARVQAQRTAVLREQLADHVAANKRTVFERINAGDRAPVTQTPGLTALREVFPKLSTGAVEEILKAASARERLFIKQNDRLPTSLLLKARARMRIARLNQALVGLQLDNAASADSRRLALHALEKLPGWPDNLRLEVRQQDVAGTLLDSIGSESATQVKYLVTDGYQHNQPGQFQAFDQVGNPLNSVPARGDNFYPSIMSALPDNARLQLGLPHVGQQAQLQRVLASHATTHREQMLEVLIPHAPARRFKSPLKLADGRTGYPLSGRGAGGRRNHLLLARVRDIYPNFSDEVAEGMVNQLLLEGRSTSQIFHLLNERAREYEALRVQLEHWSQADGAVFVRAPVARVILDTWRLRGLCDVEATVRLDLNAVDRLPELHANFPHVRTLGLSITNVVGQSSEAFVRQFPNVRALEVAIWQGAVGTLLVESLRSLTSIRELQVIGRLDQEFSDTAQALVDAMPQLERLALHGMTGELDVSRLSNLRSLNISGTQQSWPKGVLGLPHLRALDLSYTRITTLPDELFVEPQPLWAGLRINWARLDQEQFVKAYDYLHNDPAHRVDTEQMLDVYCRGTLKEAMDSGNEMATTALRQLKREGLSGQTLLAHVNGVRQDGNVLSEQLTVWQQTPKSVNGKPVGLRDREVAASRIRECWRNGLHQRYGAQQSATAFEPRPGPSTSRPGPLTLLADTATLELPAATLGDLPQLPTLSTTGFSHVRTLKMSEVLVSPEDFSAFLRHFPEVGTLDLSRNQLLEMPSILPGLDHLNKLSLHHNYLSITSANQTRLNGLHGLEYLDLRYNRIESLNATSLRGLKVLRLGHSAIENWPTGVLDLPNLLQLELNNSAITTIPEAALTAREGLWIDLSGCRLTENARQRLLEASRSIVPMGMSRADLRDGITVSGGPAYYPPLVSKNPELLLALPVMQTSDLSRMTAQARLQRLDSELGGAEAIQAVDELTERLGGAFPLFAQLTRWDEQFQALTRSLNEWISAPPFQLRELSFPLWVSAMERRKAADLILACWRQNLRGAVPVEGLDGGFTLDLFDIPLGRLPALSGDFAHVGVLKLNRLFLAENGLDGFLDGFAGVHTLELNGNQLTMLPEPVTALPALRRLSASHNRLSASPALQTHLSALTHLQSLDLSQNWLEELDVSALTGLERLALHGNRLVYWPGGVLTLPALRALDLRDNMIETIPQVLMSDAHRRLRAGTNLANNDNLEGASLIMLRNHMQDGETMLGWPSTEIDEVLESLVSDSDFDTEESAMSDEMIDVSHVTGTAARERWIDPAADDAEALTRVWNDLEQVPDSAAFFNLLDGLDGTRDFLQGRTELTRRVHRVLTVAEQNPELREVLFNMAKSPQTCKDGRILLFSDIEVKVFELETVQATPESQQDNVLFKLGRNLFRLGKLEKIADRDILQRQSQGGRPDAAEVRLAYRIGLRERLELPGQPTDMIYSGNVTALMLDAAYAEVIAAEQSDALIEEMVGRQYWADHLRRKYPQRFRVLKEAQAKTQGEFEDRYPDLNDAYLAELGTLEVTFKTEETALLVELSKVERLQFTQ